MGWFGKTAQADDDEAFVQETHEDAHSASVTPKGTRIAAGTTVSGTLKGEGIVEVEGVVEGEISLKGSVVVAPTGLVKGPVTADVIRVAGRIEGVVSARERLLLQRTGSLEGDTTTPSLVVEDGGRFNGRSTMPPHPQQSAPAAGPQEEKAEE